METTDDIAIPACYQTVRDPALGNEGENRFAVQPFDEKLAAGMCRLDFWMSEGHPVGCDPFVAAMAATVMPNEDIREGDKVMMPRVVSPGTSRNMGDLTVAQISVDLFRVRIFEGERYLEYLGTYFGVLPGEGSNLLQNGRGAWFPLSPKFQGMPVVPPDSQIDIRAAVLEQEADNASWNRHQ